MFDRHHDLLLFSLYPVVSQSNTQVKLAGFSRTRLKYVIACWRPMNVGERSLLQHHEILLP